MSASCPRSSGFWGEPQVKVPTHNGGRQTAFEHLKGGQAIESAVGSGSAGRSGSASVGSARSFFKGGVSLLHVG